MGHGRRELHRGIAAIIGSAILIAIFIASATFIIISLERFRSLVMDSMNYIIERNDRQIAVSGVESLWSFNGTHIVIYIDNKLSRTVLLTAVTVIYSDGCYEIMTKRNTTLNARISTFRRGESYTEVLHNLRLPQPLPLGGKAMVYIEASKKPIAVSLAVTVSTTSVVIPSSNTGFEELMSRASVF